MNTHKTEINADVYAYMVDNSVKEHSLLQEIRTASAETDGPQMLITAEQAQFLQMIVKISGAKEILEVGTYTGYSASSFALALPEDGFVTTIDRINKFPEVLKLWQPMKHKISYIERPAIEVMPELVDERRFYDIIFVDADKGNYLNYVNYAHKLLAKNGLMIIDNIFMLGGVATDSERPRYVNMRHFNKTVYEDERFDISIIPLGDGMTLLRKK